MEDYLHSLALRRRSVRKYTGEPIAREVLDTVLKTALAAPCSFGHHPVEFVVVEGAENIHRLAECKIKGGSQIKGAGAVIVVASNLERGEFWIEDAAIASSYILLAAEQQGLGACWVHIRNRDGQKFSADYFLAVLNMVHIR